MNTSYGDSYIPGGVAAIFTSREAAHDAVRELHDRDVHGTWIGLIKPRALDRDTSRTAAYAEQRGETRVESENWLSRMFGEGDESLADALVRHGVEAIDRTSLGVIAPEGAVLTVDAREVTDDTVDILENAGGRIIAGRDSFAGAGSTRFDRNAGATGDPIATTPRFAPQGTVDTIREEIFYYDPAEDLVSQDISAQRLQRPII